MDIDEQIKLLEEQAGAIRDLRNRKQRDSRFTSWRKKTLNHLENIFNEDSEYVRRFEALTFQEPRFGATGSSRSSYGDMGSFGHDLERAKTILEEGMEALRRLRPPKTTANPLPKEVPSKEPPPKEPASEDDLFFERAILEKTLSEEPLVETTQEEDLTGMEEVFKTSYQESKPSLEEVMKGSHEESGPTLRGESVGDVLQYISSLLYHYISLEEDPGTKKLLQGLRAELDNPGRSKESLIRALRALWEEEGKDILIDIMARVLARKE
jgi:hypothetical protein